MAAKLTAAIHAQGYSFLTDPVSNQIFPILPDILIQKLSRSFDFYTWQKVDEDHSAIRLVTSWATDEEAVDAFIKQIVSRVK
jgi:threonine aldolase